MAQPAAPAPIVRLPRPRRLPVSPPCALRTERARRAPHPPPGAGGGSAPSGCGREGPEKPVRRPRLRPAQPARPRNRARLLAASGRGAQGRRGCAASCGRFPSPWPSEPLPHLAPAPRAPARPPARGHVCPDTVRPGLGRLPFPSGCAHPGTHCLTHLPLPSILSVWLQFLPAVLLSAQPSSCDAPCPPCPSSLCPFPVQRPGGGEGKSSRWLPE